MFTSVPAKSPLIAMHTNFSKLHGRRLTCFERSKTSRTARSTCLGNEGQGAVAGLFGSMSR